MENVEIKLLEQMAKNKIRHITELHEKTNISQRVLYDIMNGNKRALRLDTIARLCIALNCQIGDLIIIKNGQAHVIGDDR